MCIFKNKESLLSFACYTIVMIMMSTFITIGIILNGSVDNLPLAITFIWIIPNIQIIILLIGAIYYQRNKIEMIV